MKGYSVLLYNSLHDRDLESKYIRMLLEQQTEGIILLGDLINDVVPNRKKVEELKQIQDKTKLVMINVKIDGSDCFSVRTDESKGIELLMEHLISQGHTEIGIIGGIKGITTTDIKVEAFKKSLIEHGLKYLPDRQVYSCYDIEDAQKSIRKLLSRNEKYPIAIIGINDMVAIGAVKECQNLNITEFAITGYDHTDLARTSTPELTTVSYAYDLLGKKAIQMMLKDENEISSKDLLLDPILIERESTIKN